MYVTGCNSVLGIGRATAHQYANNDARAVYICDYASDYLEIHKRELESLYPNVDIHTRVFDAADESAVKDVVDHAIQHYGRLDVFFANAATSGTWKAFTDTSVEEFESTMRTNLTRYECHFQRMHLSALKSKPSHTDEKLVSSSQPNTQHQRCRSPARTSLSPRDQ